MAHPQLIGQGTAKYALTTLVVGTKLTALFELKGLPSWQRYCERHGFDLLIFRAPLDESPRARGRSPAWQKCLVADHRALKSYSAVCWIDADVIINDEVAPSIFDHVTAGSIGAVEAWASPTREAYERFTSVFNSEPGAATNADADAFAYYSRFGLPPDFPTVVQTGVIVLSPAVHGPIFRKTYDQYEDRGAPWWHYEMRPLSYEIHKSALVQWLDPRFNYNAICDVVAIQGQSWPNRFTLLDKITVRARWPFAIRLFNRQKILSLRTAWDRSWFLHFAGFRLGLVLASA